MQTNPQAQLKHHEELEAILKPLGFMSSSLGVFYQPKHEWFKFDLSAIDTKPEVVLQSVMDHIWDTAKSVGSDAARLEIRKAIGLK